MNFFGHAAVARHVSNDAGFLLGAMAPDLLAMCGLSPDALPSARVAAGQAHHLVVDSAFHGSPAFVSLQAWTARSLVEAGLRRGPARGAAHVAIELLLDGVLAGDAAACAAYQRGLACAEAAPGPFDWRDESAAQRWRAFIRRLRSGRIPQAYGDPLFVADRLAGALSGRPRLALLAGELATLRAFLPALQRRVIAEASALIPAPV